MPEGLTPAGVEGADSAGLGKQLRVPLAYAAFAALFGSLPLVFVCLFFGAFKTWWAITLFSLMGATVVAGVAFNFRQVLEMFTTRRAAAGASVALAVAAGLVILIAVNWISHHELARATWDITEDQKFTLSSATQGLMGKLEEGKETLCIVSFLPYQVSPRSGLPPNYLEQVAELLRLYDRSDRIKVTITNPDGELNRTEAAAKEIGITLENIPRNTVVLKRGEKRKDVSINEIFQTFPQMNPYAPPRPAVFQGEDAITSAIRDVLDDTERKVYFVTGHGERTTGHKPRDYGVAVEGLRGMNFKIEDANLAGKGAVPEDANILVVAGPTAPISDGELDMLEAYLDDGGGLLVALDLLDTRQGHVRSGLERLLKKYGVEVHQDVMAVGREMAFTSVTIGIPSGYHEISEPLSTRQAMLHQACVLDTGSPVKEGYDARRVLEGTDGSWGERDLRGAMRYSKDKDMAGPTTLGVAVGPRESDPSTPFGPTGRAHIVVFADADFLSNQLMSDRNVSFSANSDLFLNAVNWMAGKTENIGIQPREQMRRTVSMTQSRKTRVFWGAVVLPALAMVVLGIVVWRLRSR
ncbi:MAG: GldG family protein [Planctomycetota bacterium]|jgi:ABC-type uncharacterized transport system involved in gliding motility auxiliary subunit